MQYHRAADGCQRRQGPDDRRPRPGVGRGDRAGRQPRPRASSPSTTTGSPPAVGAACTSPSTTSKVGEAAGHSPDPVPAGQGQDGGQVRRRSTARRPTTTPRCSSRATTACCRRQAGWTKVADQSTADWDNQTAGRHVQLDAAARTPDIKAVMVANDTMAGAVITDLKQQSSTARSRCPVRTPPSRVCSRSWTGNQCFTIYKPSVRRGRPGRRGDRRSSSPARSRRPPTVTVDPTDQQARCRRSWRRRSRSPRPTWPADQRRLHAEGARLHRHLRGPVHQGGCQVVTTRLAMAWPAPGVRRLRAGHAHDATVTAESPPDTRER